MKDFEKVDFGNGVRLGDTVTDTITGFRGTVTGCVAYLTGCNQALVVPRVKDDGTLTEAQWFDVQRLSVDRATRRVSLDNGSTPGCDRPAPKR